MSVDVRTRSVSLVTDVDAAAFLDLALPAMFRSEHELLASAGALRLRPCTIDIEGDLWNLRREDDDTFDVSRGRANADRCVEVRLTRSQFTDLISDQVTPIGLFTAGLLDLPAGQIGHLLDWWLVLRSLLDRKPVYTSGSIVLPADLTRSFTLEDDPADLRTFLEATGFLHLRGVFTEAEMDQISREMDSAAPNYADGDGDSWWATVTDGTRHVVRMQRFDQHSPATAALIADPRFLGLADIAASGHIVGWAHQNRVEALFKPIGVVDGISDVPWHKDCSLGRHSYECCALTVGISITGAGPTSGQLRVIAGSHRAHVWPSLLDTSTLDLPDVPLATSTGDVTIHLSCTLHMAQPPTHSERRVLYSGFALAPDDPGASGEAQRRLRATARENAPRTTSQPATAP